MDEARTPTTPTPTEPREVMNLEQVSEWLGKSPRAVWSWAVDGRMPSKKIANTRLFSRAAILKWMETK